MDETARLSVLTALREIAVDHPDLADRFPDEKRRFRFVFAEVVRRTKLTPDAVMAAGSTLQDDPDDAVLRLMGLEGGGLG